MEYSFAEGLFAAELGAAVNGSDELFDGGDLDSTSILAYLKDSVLSESNGTISSIVVEVSGIEDSIVQKYLEVQTLKLRTSIQASYSVVVKSELNDKWGQSSRQALLNVLAQVSFIAIDCSR